jgi:hypothetical protein
MRIRLLEVARGLDPKAGFRFAAELRPATPRQDVGVYVGRSLQTAGGGPCHCMVAVRVMSPNPAAKKKGEQEVVVQACATVDPREFARVSVKAEYPVAGPDSYTLVVTLTEADLVVAVNGRPFFQATRNGLGGPVSALGRKIRAFAATTPTFLPSEGVGIFSYDGPAEVRSVRMERAGV